MIDILNYYDDIITDYHVILYEQEKRLYRLKIEIRFIDNSTLYVKEFVNYDFKKRKYSFHWNNNKKEMLVRWDNAPHYKNLSSFPHHKHFEGNVIESREVTLDDVLREIEKTIHRDNSAKESKQ